MNLQKKIKKLKNQVKKLEEQYKREQEDAALDKLHEAFKIAHKHGFKNCRYYVGYEIYNAIESLHKRLCDNIEAYTSMKIISLLSGIKYMGNNIILNPNLDGTMIEIVMTVAERS